MATPATTDERARGILASEGQLTSGRLREVAGVSAGQAHKTLKKLVERGEIQQLGTDDSRSIVYARVGATVDMRHLRSVPSAAPPATQQVGGTTGANEAVARGERIAAPVLFDQLVVTSLRIGEHGEVIVSLRGADVVYEMVVC